MKTIERIIIYCLLAVLLQGYFETARALKAQVGMNATVTEFARTVSIRLLQGPPTISDTRNQYSRQLIDIRDGGVIPVGVYRNCVFLSRTNTIDMVRFENISQTLFLGGFFLREGQVLDGNRFQEVANTIGREKTTLYFKDTQ